MGFATLISIALFLDGSIAAKNTKSKKTVCSNPRPEQPLAERLSFTF
jgi:hypothetical protein